MLQVTRDMMVTPQQARSILTEHTARMPMYIDLDKCVDYQTGLVIRLKPALRQLRLMTGDHFLTPTSRAAFREILKTRFGVPNAKLQYRGEDSIQKKVLDALLLDPSIHDSIKMVINQWKLCGGYAYKIGALEQYINNPLSEGESFDGHRMVMARPRWEILSTGRISASEPSLQNLTESIADIITCPKGYILVGADSGQIEPRLWTSFFVVDDLVKYCIDLYDDAYFGQLRYILMDSREEMMYRKDLSKIEKVELPESQRKQLKTLALAGNYGSVNLDEVDARLAYAYAQKIKNNPLQVDHAKKARERVNEGYKHCETLFGRKITPTDEKTKYKEGTRAWVEHLVRCFINNPVQGTAADLINIATKAADTIIRTESNYKNAIIYSKHDELRYMLDERDAHLAEKLAGCTSYQLEGGIPIRSKMELGVHGGTKEWLDYSITA